jgi:uncharacterized membrane protein
MTDLSFETSVQIDAPTGIIYDYIADFPRHVEWNHQPVKMTPLTDGPVRVGSRYQTDEQLQSNASLGTKIQFALMTPILKLMFGTYGYTVAEITTLDPNKGVAWKASFPSKKKGDLVRMKWEVRLQPQSEGSQVVQRCEINMPAGSPLPTPNETFMQKEKEETELNLTRLKGTIETQLAGTTL